MARNIEGCSHPSVGQQNVAKFFRCDDGRNIQVVNAGMITDQPPSPAIAEALKEAGIELMAPTVSSED
jgi:hypothetical protein